MIQDALPAKKFSTFRVSSPIWCEHKYWNSCFKDRSKWSTVSCCMNSSGIKSRECVVSVISFLFIILVFGDEFLAHGLHLKSHQRCSAAFCRAVNFFHTDWIIISLWFLSYTQRHCHVRIEKGSVQTVAVKSEAHNSLEYHYILNCAPWRKNTMEYNRDYGNIK